MIYPARDAKPSTQDNKASGWSRLSIIAPLAVITPGLPLAVLHPEPTVKTWSFATVFGAAIVLIVVLIATGMADRERLQERMSTVERRLDQLQPYVDVVQILDTADQIVNHNPRQGAETYRQLFGIEGN